MLKNCENFFSEISGVLWFVSQTQTLFQKFNRLSSCSSAITVLQFKLDYSQFKYSDLEEGNYDDLLYFPPLELESQVESFVFISP